MIRGGESYQFVKDHLGSVKLVIKVSDGSITQAITYDEFGKILTDSNLGFQPFGFAGGVYDHQASLTKFGVRDYDPEVGRWLTKDPILFNGGDANLYGYVLMDPVSFVDPYGEFAFPLIPLAIPALEAAFVWTAATCVGVGVGIAASEAYNDSKEPPKGGHKKNKRKSTSDKHAEGDRRRKQDQWGEKGDANRPYRRK